jgi:hypothetical protein
MSKDVTIDLAYLSRNCKTTYEREIILLESERILNPRTDITIHMNTRLLVEKLYNITVEQQLYIERYLDDLIILQPLNIDLPFPSVWREFYSIYSLNLESFRDHVYFQRNGFATPFYMSPGVMRIAYH